MKDKPYLWKKNNNEFESLSWKNVELLVKSIARSLIGLGILKGDRVVILSENRPEWQIADLAIMSIGAITVPVYTTSTTSDYSHVINHSGARCIIISSHELCLKALPALESSSDCKNVIKINDDNHSYDNPVNILQWSDLANNQESQNYNFDDEIKSKLLMKEEVRYSLESSIQIELQHLSESNSGSPEHLLNHLNSLYLMIDWEQTDYLSTTCLGGYLETLGQAYFLLARYMGHDHDMHDCFEKSRIFLWAAQDVVEESEDGHMLTIRAMLNPSFENLPWDELSLQQSKQILDYIDSLIGGGHIE